MLKKPELLAPAGGWESFVAAVQNGADAVYLGGRMFNARRSAINFENQEIVRAIEYAHLRGVKVYVTVNILIADREMEEAAGFLLFLYNAGASGN
ncbi:MAG: Peptidase U32 [Desulfotomaculum sp. 46_296]|nr:MAG: Peptidase U32 [Desulfotomaculum sp. 46_296]